MTEKSNPTNRPELTRRQKIMRRTVPLALTAAAVATVATPAGRETIANVSNAVEQVFGDGDIQFSTELSTHVTESGDTVWEIAHKVEGASQVNPTIVVDYIENMPENANIKDVNGNLMTGVQVSYPTRIEN